MIPRRGRTGSKPTLKPNAAAHVADLVSEFQAERDDRGLRCWLLELIGEARSPAAFEALAEQLWGPDEDPRRWAVRGLELLGTTS
jgi:hypothetical protein